MDKALLNTISGLINSGSLAAAHELMKQNESAHDNDSQFWEVLAIVEGMSGNNPGCKNACERAIQLNPEKIGNYINLGTAQQNLGHLDESEAALLQAVKMNESHPQVQNNLGALYILKSDYTKARPHIEKAIALKPDYSDAYSNLGEIQKYYHDHDNAIKSYNKSIEINANNINSYIGLGSVYTLLSDYDKARHYLTKALDINPHHPEALFNFGFLNYTNKEFELASDYFQRTIKISPDHQYAKYLLSAITDTNTPDRSPDEYVRGLFDHYAKTFDKHLVQDLGYTVPDKMYALVDKDIKPTKKDTLLDLGCGTGICGEKFNKMYNKMTGIDISENMISQAKEKNIYDSLQVTEISSFLESNTTQYDLIIAADVFVYIGDIAELVFSIGKAQNHNGYFIFSVEKSSNHITYHLRSTGRYAHNKSYIETITNDAGYSIVIEQPTIIRNEKGNGIEGLIFVCQKKSSIN